MSDTEARWEYKLEKGKYYECEILLYFNKTKKVVVNISVRSGVIMIKGQYFCEWMNMVFPNLLDYVNNNSASDENSPKSTTHDDTVEHMVVNEDMDDINKLWQECSLLKSGLVTLEKSVEKVIQSNHYVADLLERKSKDIDQKIESLESMYDNKLTVLMNAVSTDCRT